MSAILSHQNKARAATNNPVGRFEKLDLDAEESDRADWPGNHEEDHPRPLKTEFFRDSNKSVLVYNDSPDIGPGVMLNPYRGCEHGCIYCFARPNHEYLGLSAGLDFESKIFVKTDAPALLRKELNAKKWTPQMIALSGVTDCYQPVERKLKLTRQCLEVLAEFKNPVGLITKNHLITRDLDILQDMARWNGAAAYISLTTLDADLQKIMEPRTSPPKARLRAIETLAKAGPEVSGGFAGARATGPGGPISTVKPTVQALCPAAQPGVRASRLRPSRPGCGGRRPAVPRRQPYPEGCR